MLSTDWTQVTIAGSFVAGAVLGAIAVLKLTRHLLEYLSKQDKDRDG